jgi:superfamily II DNA or RNA helicase
LTQLLHIRGASRTPLPKNLLDNPRLQEICAYTDSATLFELKRWKDYLVSASHNPHFWAIQKFGFDGIQAKVAELQRSLNQSVIQDGTVPTGLIPRICTEFGCIALSDVDYPEPRPMGWHEKPRFELRPYQKEATDSLIEARHGAVSLATGTGKTRIAMELTRRLGLKTVIATPFTNIAEQIYAEFRRHLGPHKVGRFWGGKKESTKQVVISVSKSLTLLTPDSEHYHNIARAGCLIVDESHQFAAATLKTVAEGVCGNIPWRFFLSGTQIRSDGRDIILEGVIGKIVAELEVRDAVDQGYLTRPRFLQVGIDSLIRQSQYEDPIASNRKHLQLNPDVYVVAGKLIRSAISKGRRPVVFIDQLEQFSLLEPYLKGLRIGFAHGGATPKNRGSIDSAYWKSDPLDLVARFDNKQIDILVGTSVIGTGTDIKSASALFDLVGLSSEVRIRQNVGRGTRLHEDKADFWYVDFDIRNVRVLNNHAKTRAKIFEDIYGPVRTMSAA